MSATTLDRRSITGAARRNPRPRRERSSKGGTAIYARISFDRDANKAGVDRQTKECRELATRLGLDPETIHPFEDPNISAYKGRPRPGFEAMCDAIAAGLISRVLVWHPDRLTRSTTELEGLISFLDEYDVTIETVTGGSYNLRDKSERMKARMVGVFAQYESEHKAERHVSKHRELAEQGKRPGGRRPFGFTDSTCLVVDEREAAIIREAYARVVDGQSCRSIALDFTRRGILTTYGKAWQGGTLARALRRPDLTALRVLHGVEYESERGVEGVKNGWPMIVDRDTWRRAQAILNDESRKQRTAKVPSLLAGLVWTTYSVDEMGEANKGVAMRSARVDGRDRYAGPGVNVWREDLDAIVLALVFDHLRASGLVHDGSDAAKRREELEAKRERIMGEKRLVHEEYRAKRLTVEEWRDLNADLAEQVAEVEDLLVDLVPMLGGRIASLVSEPGRLEAEYEAGHVDVREMQQALRLVLDAVLVKPSLLPGGVNAKLSRNPDRVVPKWRADRKATA